MAKKTKRKTRSVKDPGGQRFVDPTMSPARVRNAKAKKGRGRRSKRDLPLELEKVLLNVLSLGLTQEHACQVVHIHHSTLADWKKSDQEFANKIDAAKPKRVAHLATLLIQHCESKNERISLDALKWVLPKLAEEYTDTTKQVHILDDDPDQETPDPAFL